MRKQYLNYLELFDGIGFMNVNITKDCLIVNGTMPSRVASQQIPIQLNSGEEYYFRAGVPNIPEGLQYTLECLNEEIGTAIMLSSRQNNVKIPVDNVSSIKLTIRDGLYPPTIFDNYRLYPEIVSANTNSHVMTVEDETMSNIANSVRKMTYTPEKMSGDYMLSRLNLYGDDVRGFKGGGFFTPYTNPIDLTNAYANNITDLVPVCGENVVSISGAFANCQNTTSSPICGVNVVDMSRAFFNCMKIQGNPICGPKVNNMSEAYYYCHNITGIAACGPNVVTMYRAYSRCTNLTQAVCGPNVVNMSYAYNNCFNLTQAVCGPNVVNMSYAYGDCYNLLQAVCGPNVVDMHGTYAECTNLTQAVCGPNVVNMSYAYDTCSHLLQAVCGPNVTNMYMAYNSCGNLKQSACGPNVTNMSYAYSRCTNLAQAVCGPNVVDMTGSYNNCRSLSQAVCGPKVTKMNYAYAQCYYITQAVCGPNVIYMENAYKNCRELRDGILGPNVQYANQVYNNCKNMFNLYILNTNGNKALYVNVTNTTPCDITNITAYSQRKTFYIYNDGTTDYKNRVRTTMFGSNTSISDWIEYSNGDWYSAMANCLFTDIPEDFNYGY